MYFCNSVTSPTYPLFSPPLVSLFSVNSSLSLYNPCNNPEERARKTLFFLTLIPTDPTLLWFLALLQGISANRSLRSQELALGMYSRGEGDVRITRTQFPRTGCPAVMCSGSRPSAFQSLFLPVHGDFQKEKRKNYACQLSAKNIHLCIFIVWLIMNWLHSWYRSGAWEPGCYTARQSLLLYHCLLPSLRGRAKANGLSGRGMSDVTSRTQ